MTQQVKILLGIGIASLIILIGAVFLLSKSANVSTNPSSTVSNPQLLVKPNSHQTASGSAHLKVTVVEFGDYQCPACGAAYPVTKQMLKDYDGKINFVFRNFPLSQHQYALIAAEAAEAGGAQGKFWQMHDKLYETQNDWSSSNQPMDLFTGYAKDLGLDVSKFQSDVTSNKFSDIINADLSDGNSLGINETPTFFVNSQEIAGVPSYDQLKSLIDNDLK